MVVIKLLMLELIIIVLYLGIVDNLLVNEVDCLEIVIVKFLIFFLILV